MFWLNRFLNRFIKTGCLVVVDTRGRVHSFGPDRDKAVTVVIRDRWLPLRLGLNPRLCFGEAYMNGAIEICGGALDDLLELCGRNIALSKRARRGFIARAVLALHKRISQFNSATRAKHNVAHHYDLSRQLYESFLDSDLQYSCAYFAWPGIGLDEAQAAKKRHIAAKLRLQPGQRVLDIGCGWGGLALDLAREHQVNVDGITLSREQLAVARERSERLGMADAVRFDLADYRDVAGCYDRIVSVGMLEHVGAPYYPAFFQRVSELLAPNGVAVIHAIGSFNGPGAGNPWISKYIFPGGYIPALSEVMPAIEKSGLFTTDIEVLRLHYAETLKLWRERFSANWSRIGALYDERFRRMWEFYLASCEMAFRHDGLMVFQMQLSKKVDAVPLTRDYIGAAERRTRPRAVRGVAA